MLEDDTTSMADPAAQLASIKKIRETSTAKLKYLDNSIQKFLTRFEKQQKALDTLYNQTQQQQRISTNIMSVHDRLETIVALLDTWSRLSPKIDGPIEGYFNIYMNAMDQIHDSIIQLSELIGIFDEAQNTIINLTGLQSHGIKKVSSLFQKMVDDLSEPISLDIFQFSDGHFIVTDENYKKNVCYPLTDNEASQFSRMVSCLRSIQSTEDLLNLKSPPTTSSSKSKSKSISIEAKPSQLDPFKKYYLDSRIKSCWETFSQLIANAAKRSQSTSPMNILDIPSYQPLSHPFIMLGYSLSFILNRERVLTEKIFGEDGPNVFKSLITHRVSSGGNEKIIPNFWLSSLESLAKLEIPIQSQCDVLLDCDIVTTLTYMRSTIPFIKPNEPKNTPQKTNSMVVGTPTVQITNSTKQSLIDQVFSSISDHIVNCLRSFSEAVEKHDQWYVTPGGSVSAMTSNVILFLIKLTDYQTCVDNLSGCSLSGICEEVLNNLNTNLNEKAKHYNDQVITQIFLMNNQKFELDTITTTKLEKVVNHDLVSNLEKSIQAARDHYIALTWDTAFSKLVITDNDNMQDILSGKPGIKMNKKQRKVIKYKFRDFSKRVDELRQMHQNYVIKNQDLLSQILQITVRKVNQIYDKFYIKWKDSGFSQSPEKWICYQPATLNQMINRLYNPTHKKI